MNTGFYLERSILKLWICSLHAGSHKRSWCFCGAFEASGGSGCCAGCMLKASAAAFIFLGEASCQALSSKCLSEKMFLPRGSYSGGTAASICE